jgi:hypothetical protein
MASTCPACGAAAFTSEGGGGTCGRCGYASGEANRCPHCGAVARTEGRGLATICAMCGGPRVPHNEGGEASARHLKEQKAHLATARLASAATVLQAIFAALATLVGLALTPASIAGKLFVFAIALVPLVLALRSRARAKSAREAADRAGEQAWQAAAEAIAAGAPKGITAPALAKALDVEEPHADRLLTALAVHDRTRVDLGDDAEVVYSVPPDRLRSEDSEEEPREGRVR